MMKIKKIAPYVLVLCGAALIVCGVLRGEAAMILSKGVNLCFECIGIG